MMSSKKRERFVKILCKLMKHSLSLGVKGFFISQAKREVKHTHTYTPKYTYAHPHTPVQTEAVSEQCIETT